MKRYNYIIILSLVALCFGCSDTMEEPREADAIQFSVSDGWPDESPVTRSDAFTMGDHIGVFACYRTTDGTTDGTNTNFVPNYMLNQLVEFDGAAWSYSPVKYWPTDGSVDFFGYFPYDASHKETDDGFVHECKTGFEPLYRADAEVVAKEGVLTGTAISEGGKLQLGFLPMLNKVNFTAQAKGDLFEHGGVYTDFHFLIKEFRIWGFFKKAKYSMTDKKWTTEGERYTRKNPLDMTAAIRKVTIEGSKEVPEYKYDPDKGFCSESALVISKGANAKEIFDKSAHFIPLYDAVEDNEPTFEVVYVVLTKPAGENNDYKESGIVTRSGSLKEIFNGAGLIEKNININLFFGIDGVTVTRTLEDYTYKPMF